MFSITCKCFELLFSLIKNATGCYQIEIQRSHIKLKKTLTTSDIATLITSFLHLSSQLFHNLRFYQTKNL